MSKFKKLLELKLRLNKRNNQLQTYLPKSIRDAIKKEGIECKKLLIEKWRVE